jgi:predicted permease
MNQIAAVVLPVFGMIAVGYAIAWLRLVSTDTEEAIADFVYAVPLPVLLFQTVITAEIVGGTTPVLLWLTHFAGFFLVWVAGTLIVRRAFGRDARTGVIGGIASAYANAFMLGIPLVVAAYGRDALTPITLIVAVQLPLLMALSTIMVERALISDGIAESSMHPWATAFGIVKKIATNPIVVSVVAGVGWRLGGLSMPAPVETIVERIANVAGSLALIALGLGLKKHSVKGNIKIVLSLTVLKLLVMPAIVLLAVIYVVPLPPLWASVAVVVAACPSGSNVYVVASRFRTAEALASGTMILTTAVSVISVTLWLAIVDRWISPAASHSAEKFTVPPTVRSR